MPRVYQCATMGEAELRVALVTAQGQADLLVHRVDSQGQARRAGLWFFTRERHQADVRIYLCSLGMAQLRVCFVNGYGAAGWVQAGHPWRRRLGE